MKTQPVCCRPARLSRVVLSMLMLGLLAACAGPQVGQRISTDDDQRPGPPEVTVSAYPAAGQSERQLRRDRYECHQWAVQESGFDPSATPLSRAPRPVRVAAYPPVGEDTTRGMFGGAILGAMVSNPYHSGRGAAVGAMIGAGLGLFSDLARLFQASRIEAEYAERAADPDQGNWPQARAYRRALAACLDGRQYSVR